MVSSKIFSSILSQNIILRLVIIFILGIEPIRFVDIVLKGFILITGNFKPKYSNTKLT